MDSATRPVVGADALVGGPPAEASMVGDRPVVGGALLLAFLGLMVAVAVALTVSQVRELVHPALVGLIGSVVGAVIGAVWGATAHRDDERVPSAERERTTAPH